MKSVKTKLVSAIAMLMVATVMMTSASFAWFTVSTAPQIEDIDVTMTAVGGNLEIARATSKATGPSEVTDSDTGSETAWGSTVAGFSATLDFPATVTSAGVVQTVTYDEDGRTAGLDDAQAGTLSSTTGVYTYTKDVGFSQGEKTVAAAYGIWLRANESCTATAKITGTYADPWSVAFVIDGTVSEPNASGEATISLTDTTNGHYVEMLVYVEGDVSKGGVVAADDLVINGGSITNLVVDFSRT